MTQFSEWALRNQNFSWQNLLSLAMASKYSYQSPGDFAKILRTGWNVEITQTADVSDTQGYLLESDQVAILVYRGTESIGDWLTNANVTDTKGAFGEFHSGFYNSFQRTQDILIPTLQAASDAGKSIWMTGHSLGGAIALCAAIETHAAINLAGLATFGQPRACRFSTANKVQEQIGRRFYRLVNDDDIVPRVPLSYSHAGSLYHFDEFGELKAGDQFAALENSGPEQGPLELTEAEFQSLVKTIKEVKSSLEASQTEALSAPDEFGEDQMELAAYEGRFGDWFDISLEGFIPSIADHAIDRYLSVIRRKANDDTILHKSESATSPLTSVTGEAHLDLSGAEGVGLEPRPSSTAGDDGDMDFFGLESVMSDGPATAFPMAPDGFEGGFEPPYTDIASHHIEASDVETQSSETEEKHPYLLETSTYWKPPEGLEVCSRYNQITTVLATPTQRQALVDDPRVNLIEHSRDAGILELDSSVSFVKGTEVKTPPIDENGDGAIVGIIDTGIDILHNAFLDQPGGDTRLIAVWDQTDTSGPTPKQIDPDSFSQDFGTLHTRAELNKRLQAHRSGADILSGKLRDPHAHGTHVASIAAGSQFDGDCVGMAPGSPIVLVIPNMSLEEGSPRSIGYSNSHVDALAFLKRIAAGHNKLNETFMPIAINVSLGMNAGAHDGSTLLEAAFDSATNSGREPGVVIVKSAGNERTHAGHAQIQALHQGVAVIEWVSKNEPRSEDYFELWFNEADDLAFRVTSPLGAFTKEVNFDSPTEQKTLNGNHCVMELTKGYRDNGDNRLTVRIKPGTQSIHDGTWNLEVIGRQVASPNGMVDMWVERNNRRPVRFSNHDPKMTLSVPGTAKTVVTVAATDTNRPWRLNPSSSYGPTRKGRQKPDISAPGFEIRAASAGQSNPEATRTLSGTSMAAPHVTGALALVLSRLAKTPGAEMPNANQLGAALRRTVQGGQRAYRPGSGFGLLDAEALFKDLT